MALPADAPAGTQLKIGPALPKTLDSMAIQLSQDVKTISKLDEDIAKLEFSIEKAPNPGQRGRQEKCSASREEADAPCSFKDERNWPETKESS